MDVSTIFTLSRGNTGTDSSNMPDSVMLPIANQTYRDLINRIVATVGENFFYDEWETPLVVGQTEYAFPVRTSSLSGLKKVQGVSLKWKPTDTEWIKARPTTFTNFTQDKSRYASEQPESDPLYLVYDKSLNVFPAPTDTGTLKMYGISDPTDLALAGNEASVKIPLDFHHIIVLGNEYRIHKYLRNLNEKNDSLIEYENACVKMIEQLSDRITQPLESEMPYVNHLA